MIQIKKEVDVFEIITEVTYEYTDPKIELEQYIVRLGKELNWKLDGRSITSFFGIPDILKDTIVKDMVHHGIIGETDEKEVPYELLLSLQHKNSNRFYLFSVEQQNGTDKIYAVTDKGKKFIEENITEQKKKKHTVYFCEEFGFFLPSGDLKASSRRLDYKNKKEDLKNFEDITQIYNKKDAKIYGLPKNIIKLDSKNSNITAKRNIKVILTPKLDNDNEIIKEWNCKYQISKKNCKNLNRQNPYVMKKKEEITGNFHCINDILKYIKKRTADILSLKELKWIPLENLLEIGIEINNNEEFVKFIKEMKNELKLDIVKPDLNILEKMEIQLNIVDNWLLLSEAKIVPKSSYTSKMFLLIMIVNELAQAYTNYAESRNVEDVIEVKYKDIINTYNNCYFEKPSVGEILQYIWDIMANINNNDFTSEATNILSNFLDAIRMINEWKVLYNE